MAKTNNDKIIAALTVKNIQKCSPKTIKNIASWLREQAEIVELQSHELADIYTARYWRT